MVIRQSLPFDFAPRGKRLSAKTTLIVAVSLGVHAVVAAYLAMMQFAPPMTPAVEDGPLILVETVRRKPTPPPPRETKSQPPRIKVHMAPPQATDQTVEPVRVEPTDDPPRANDQIASLNVPDTAPSPPDPIINNPNWLRRPGADEFARFYPDAEMRREIEGKATISCQVTANGSVADCRVVSQTPEKSGFGAAALKLSRYFVMSPRTVDGRPVEGGQVSIPITFRLNRSS